HDHLVPELYEIVAIQQASIGANDDLMSETSLRFHELLVEGCGNAVVQLTVGGLLALWRAHMQMWTVQVQPTGEYPVPALQDEIVRAHRLITEAIDKGDQAEVARLAAKHIHLSHSH